MLADYPVAVDYNFSPVQSPLFHRHFDDDLLIPGHYEEDAELPLVENTRLLNELPHLLDDDDVSSISASIQYSEPIEFDDDQRGTPDDIKTCHAGTQDCPISGGGVDDEADSEGFFASISGAYLNSGYLSSLQDASFADTVTLDLLDSPDADLDLCINEGSSIEVTGSDSRRSKATSQRSTSQQRRRQKKKRTEDKRWNEMTVEEQEDVAEHLSAVLRSLLGPRERMEVMSMMSREKRSKLSDNDFVIEAHMLSESMLARLETFLEENEAKGEASDSELLLARPERKRGCGGNGRRRKCASLPASPQHRGSYDEGTSSSIGSKMRSNRQKSLRAWRRRSRKDYRQASKERRSGLFHKEEVLSLSQSIKEEASEEEEIDILG
ncbi:uncharacterized protein [Diadema setosum]|uniref:uncharacterized protein n=1 Tax=Diadema setosum TaxID=31175 RepID=UPI003B3ABD6D